MNVPAPDRWLLDYDRGSVRLKPPQQDRSPPAPDEPPPPLPLKDGTIPPFLRWDARVGSYRGLAWHYRALRRQLIHQRVPHHDDVRRYGTLPPLRPEEAPLYPHQEAALQAWRPSKRGVVEMPTGSGKTRLALEAIRTVGKATLILVPTLALILQWEKILQASLPSVQGQSNAADRLEVGVLGGGRFAPTALTVSTYASARLHAASLGNGFCLAIFDECHHLASEGYLSIAEKLIAPYRLGLTATLHRPDGRHQLLEEAIGKVLHQVEVGELSGNVLAPYRVITCLAHLNPQEAQTYTASRTHYQHYRRRSMPPGSSWAQFVSSAYRHLEGRHALTAYHRQRQLTLAPEDKFALCYRLLRQHRGERILIFTNDNATALRLSEDFLLPLITHETVLEERRRILLRFRENRWPVLVTSRVLNEGIDVPEVGVAIVFSGTSSVREHVQRLGRILRKSEGKHAVLYELLTSGTTEKMVSARRRTHAAYAKNEETESALDLPKPTTKANDEGQS